MEGVDLYLIPVSGKCDGGVLIPDSTIAKRMENQYPGLMKKASDDILNSLSKKEKYNLRITGIAPFYFRVSLDWPKKTVGFIQTHSQYISGSRIALYWWSRRHHDKVIAVPEGFQDYVESGCKIII